MIYTLEQIGEIVKTNPARERIKAGQDMTQKLMLHVMGRGMDDAIKQCEYFENADLFKVRKEYAVSNKDLMTRILREEDQVFSAKGGSSYFNLRESDEGAMNEVLSDVRYGMSLRKWIQTFALPAFRVDPMGIILIEADPTNPLNAATPKAYPTYKSIFSIFNYDTTGRRLEHVCFHLTAAQAINFGVADPALKEMNAMEKSKYFRFIDDEKDIIVQLNSDIVTVANAPVIDNIWNKVPGFIISDLMVFDDPKKFVSSLDVTVELADCFLYDRSVRDLQKKYHGFTKAVEPLLDCKACSGTGLLEGNTCPTCKGSTVNPITKVNDVIRFPMDLLQDAGFDYRKIIGYITPDVDGWEKQDTSLKDLEALMYMTYWGTQQTPATTGPQPGNTLEETATKTIANLQPKYSRLNATANWAERTEMLIADFLGVYWFGDKFKRSSIAYGRYYILETPDELMAQYQKMRAAGAPEASLFEAMEKYYHSVYQNDPIELAVRLKLLYVEPFPHLKISEAKGLITDFLDYSCKLYFGEWYSQKTDVDIVRGKASALREDLRAYVKQKGLKEPKPEPINQN